MNFQDTRRGFTEICDTDYAILSFCDYKTLVNLHLVDTYFLNLLDGKDDGVSGYSAPLAKDVRIFWTNLLIKKFTTKAEEIMKCRPSDENVRGQYLYLSREINFIDECNSSYNALSFKQTAKDKLMEYIKDGSLDALVALNGYITSTNTNDLTRDKKVEIQISTEYLVRSGHLHILQWFHLKNPIPNRIKLAKIAAECGHLPILQWLHSLGISSSLAGDIAIVNGKLDVVKWLVENFKDEEPAEDSVEVAVEEGHLDVLKYLHQQNLFHPDYDNLQTATQNNQVDVVKWLVLNCKVKSYRELFSDAIYHDHFEMAKFLQHYSGIKINSKDIEYAVKYSNLEILQWLDSIIKVKYNKKKCVKLAAEQHHLDMLDWFEDTHNVVYNVVCEKIPQVSVCKCDRDASYVKRLMSRTKDQKKMREYRKVLRDYQRKKLLTK